MIKNWWKKIGRRLVGVQRGVARQFRRTYIPTTTPQEVAMANKLSQDLPSDLAMYLYVSAQEGADSVVASGMVLEEQMPAEQFAQVERMLTSQEQGELVAMKVGLTLCPVNTRSLANVTVITENARLARMFADFSLAAARLKSSQRQLSLDERLAFQVLSLVDDYRHVYFTVARPSDRAQFTFLQQKNQRILQALVQPAHDRR